MFATNLMQFKDIEKYNSRLPFEKISVKPAFINVETHEMTQREFWCIIKVI
jgi:hypothetical protein